MKKIDLHIHSDFSDGNYSISEICERCKNEGVYEIAITDHDTVEGIMNYEHLQERFGLKIIPATEISVDYLSMHILGYGIGNFEKLQNVFNSIRLENEQSCIDSIKKMKDKGIDISVEKVRIIKRYNTITRRDIVRYFLYNNYAENYREVYERFIGKRGLAYIPNIKLNYKAAIDLIHECGGIAVLAHPGAIENINNYEELIVCLKNNGLDGIETHTSKHTYEQILFFQELSKKYQLVQTFGTDFHNTGSIGFEIEDELLEKFHNAMFR